MLWGFGMKSGLGEEQSVARLSSSYTFDVGDSAAEMLNISVAWAIHR